MTKPTPQSSPPRWLFPTVIGVLVAGVVLIAVVVAGSRDDDGDGTAAASGEVGPVNVTGDPLPGFGGDPTEDPAVGAAAPSFTATTFDGTEITVDVADGTGRMIGFFAHWCPHCQREIPTVVDWLADGGLPDGVEVVGVSTGVDEGAPNFPPSDWFARERFDPLVVRDDAQGTLAGAYGLSGFPFWVVVDGEGNVVQRISGERTPEDLSTLASLAR